jgi:hypothetical protein
MDPLDSPARAQGFCQPVQAIPNHPKNAFHPGLRQRFRNQVCNIADCHDAATSWMNTCHGRTRPGTIPPSTSQADHE